MKSIIQYIKEEYQNFTISEVIVTYDIIGIKKENEDIVIQIPESYLEDDMQIYLEDYFFPKLFLGSNYDEKYFGANASKIIDSYFEYKGFEEVESSDNYIEFDSRYDEKESSGNKLKLVKFKEMKLIIKFENFIIKDEDNDKFEELLFKIFNAPITDREWMFKFKLDSKNIKYQN